MDQFRHTLAFGRCADNNPEIFGAYAFNQLPKARFFFGCFDFLGDGNLVAERDQNHVAAGQGDLCCQSWTFGRDRFFDYLDEEFLSGSEEVGDGALFVDVGQQ